MPWYTVSADLPPAPQPSAIKLLAWLTFVWAVGFCLARVVLA